MRLYVVLTFSVAVTGLQSVECVTTVGHQSTTDSTTEATCLKICDCEFSDTLSRWLGLKSTELQNERQKIQAELPNKLGNLTKTLKVETRALTSAKLKKVSAQDARPSATVVGGTVGIVFLTIFTVGMIALDFPFLSGLVKSMFTFCKSKIHVSGS